jgi:hypothetical protein
LSAFPIFRVGHPPLFFPWADISTEAGSRRLFGDFVKFKFAKRSDVPVIFSKKRADQFLEGAQTNGHTSEKRYLYKYEISPCYERKEILNNKKEL